MDFGRLLFCPLRPAAACYRLLGSYSAYDRLLLPMAAKDIFPLCSGVPPMAAYGRQWPHISHKAGRL